MIAFLVFVAIFAAALVYFQFFAFYERLEPPTLIVAETNLPVRDWEGIDAASSPLKLRGCFETEPEALAMTKPAADATPLVAPFWFRCFDAKALAEDLARGQAAAYPLSRDEPAGFDTMVAVYPDGRAYMWRQLNERFR